MEILIVKCSYCWLKSKRSEEVATNICEVLGQYDEVDR